jgi:hypothetical protein
MSLDHFQHYWELIGPLTIMTIINLKTRKMIFEDGKFRVVAPLDPSNCERYVEPVPDSVLEDDVNQLYRTICARGRLCESNFRWSNHLEEYQF